MTKSILIGVAYGGGPVTTDQNASDRLQPKIEGGQQFRQHQQIAPVRKGGGGGGKRLISATLPLPVPNKITVGRRGQKRLQYHKEHASGAPGRLGWDRDQSQLFAGHPVSPTGDLPEVHSFPGLLDDQQPDDDHSDLNSIPVAPLASALPIPQVYKLDCASNINQATTSFSGHTQSYLHHSSVHKPGGELTIKEESLSPRDTNIAGTSTDYIPFPSQTHHHHHPHHIQIPHAVANPPPAVAPLIPVTALELLSKDSSESSSGEDVFSGANAATASAPRNKIKSSGSAGEASGKSGGRKISTRRKSDISSPQSEEDDSSDEGIEDEQDSFRLERRRHSNRVAAQKCRQRQRQHYTGLTKEIQEWECKKTSATYEVRQLQKELKKLLGVMEEHEQTCSTGVRHLTEEEKAEYQKLVEWKLSTDGASQSKDQA